MRLVLARAVREVKKEMECKNCGCGLAKVGTEFIHVSPIKYLRHAKRMGSDCTKPEPKEAVVD